MATAAEQVAASQMRQRIPTEWLLEFQDWTSEGLLSLSEDAVASPEIRAYASWELDYRLAFDAPGPKMPVLEARNDSDSALDAIVRQRIEENERRIMASSPRRR